MKPAMQVVKVGMTQIICQSDRFIKSMSTNLKDDEIIDISETPAGLDLKER